MMSRCAPASMFSPLLPRIYTDSNVRVRAARARVSEIQRQLRQLGGGQDETASAGNTGEGYPSIRRLPQLGVTYEGSSDLAPAVMA